MILFVTIFSQKISPGCENLFFGKIKNKNHFFPEKMRIVEILKRDRTLLNEIRNNSYLVCRKEIDKNFIKSCLIKF